MRTIAFCLAAFTALAQSSAFEAATIRPADPQSNARSAARLTPDRVSYQNITLRTLLGRAFEIKTSEQIQGPSWISSERFDVNAKAPDHTPPEQIPKMLQTLLIERFQLELHHETRELPAYVLVAGKGKLKMEESKAEGARDTLDMTGPRRAARNMSMATLAQYVSLTARTPVVDQTGMSGRFNFPYEMSSEEMGGKDGYPSIFTIVEELGLKLESKKLPFDVVVIDRGNKVPIEN